MTTSAQGQTAQRVRSWEADALALRDAAATAQRAGDHDGVLLPHSCAGYPDAEPERPTWTASGDAGVAMLLDLAVEHE